MKQSILSAKGLCKSFAHNGGQVHILSNVDLTIYEGDFTVVMGASGSENLRFCMPSVEWIVQQQGRFSTKETTL